MKKKLLKDLKVLKTEYLIKIKGGNGMKNKHDTAKSSISNVR